MNISVADLIAWIIQPLFQLLLVFLSIIHMLQYRWHCGSGSEYDFGSSSQIPKWNCEFRTELNGKRENGGAGIYFADMALA